MKPNRKKGRTTKKSTTRRHATIKHKRITKKGGCNCNSTIKII